jgi:hypothetical protein
MSFASMDPNVESGVGQEIDDLCTGNRLRLLFYSASSASRNEEDWFQFISGPVASFNKPQS